MVIRFWIPNCGRFSVTNTVKSRLMDFMTVTASIKSVLQRLNRATQQNAASAEEIAAMSAELATQAEQLQQAIPSLIFRPTPEVSL
jgi:hypothetical protein